MDEKTFELLSSLIDMAGAAGDGAFWMVVVWFAIDVFKFLITTLGLLGAGLYVARMIYTAILADSGYIKFANTVRAVAGEPAGPCSSGEIERCAALVKKGLEASGKSPRY